MLILIIFKIPCLTYIIPFAIFASPSYSIKFKLPDVESAIAPYYPAVAVHLAVQDLALVHVLAEQDPADAHFALCTGLHLTRVLVICQFAVCGDDLLFYGKARIEAYFAIVDQLREVEDSFDSPLLYDHVSCEIWHGLENGN